MAGKIKNILFILLLVLSFSVKAFAENDLSILTSPQQISFDDTCKKFNIQATKLFYLTLSSIHANRFNIIEMQSKSGYILFSVSNKKYLANIVNIDGKRSLLKITPIDCVYNFPPGIYLNIFKYIELNEETELEEIIKSN